MTNKTFVLFLIFSTVVRISADTISFEQRFHEFFKTNNYHGAQVGVVIDNRLAFAKAFGNKHSHNINPGATYPIYGISKAFTSISILKLYNEGLIKLTSKVFGEHGILSEIKPWRQDNVDRRIYDITVKSLLYHTAGWDYVQSDLSDPMLNSILLRQGITEKNITKEMRLNESPTADHIIRYMLSRRLDFTPDTKSVVSNLGYVILGRIIEQVTNVTYNEYVKTRILFPCGMFHTHIGRTQHCSNNHKEPVYDKCEVSPICVAPALGWESNVYDLARFSQCMDGSADYSILDENTAKLILQNPKFSYSLHFETWMGPGFQVNNNGEFWMEGEKYTNDLLFLHYGMLHGKSNTSKTTGDKPMAVIVLLEGRQKSPLKGIISETVHSERKWAITNKLLEDIADISVTVDQTERIIKCELNEHHLKPYSHAIGQLSYDVKWIHGHMQSGKTCFTVIAEKSRKPLYDQVIIEHGLTDKTLESYKLKIEKLHYNLTFLHTYKSYSHNKRPVYLAIFRKNAYSNTTIIRYGEEHFTQPYKKLLHLYEEVGFYPKSQSVVHSGYDGLVSFIFEEDLSSKKNKEFRSYVEVGQHRLNKLVTSSFRHGRRLTSLDSSDYFGHPVFSAVFVKENMRKIAFNSNLKEEELIIMAMDQQKKGLLPTIAVSFKDKFGFLKYAAYFEPPL